MATVNLRTPAISGSRLLRGLLRDTAAPATEPHLHYDRAARIWRMHDQRDAHRAPVETAAALQECA
jgi:hypothetical protein